MTKLGFKLREMNHPLIKIDPVEMEWPVSSECGGS
jgi:hypothetical protein